MNGCPRKSDFGVTIFARKSVWRKLRAKDLNRKRWLRWRNRRGVEPSKHRDRQGRG